MGKPDAEEILVARFPDYLTAHPDIKFPHRHSFYHMALFTSDSGFHTIDFEKFPVKAGQFYFMIPGQVHSWHFEGHPDGYVLNVSAHFFNAFLQDGAYLERFPFFSGAPADGVVQLPPAALRTVTSLLDNMLMETDGQQAFNLDMLRLLLLQVYIVAGRISLEKTPGQAPPQNYMLLRNFRKLVETHFMQQRLPKDYAAMLYVTPNYLNAFCRDIIGKSAGEVIRDRVLLEAKRLLINADMPVSAIAYQLNFADNSYFTKFFKKYAGVTPEEFRKSIA